jgi:hypothetical protein
LTASIAWFLVCCVVLVWIMVFSSGLIWISVLRDFCDGWS